MFGPPQDVPGECNDKLEVGDDYGDNSTTFRCSLNPNHTESHKEEFELGDHKVVVTWTKIEE